MEFIATIGQEQFTFSQINRTSFLVTGSMVSLILYKVKNWQCADGVSRDLVSQLGRAIDQYHERCLLLTGSEL
ncbi:MAG TPA: hypothetical protein VNS32_20120 [Flavisolibacter sp.]|nr:hypothetical protein [Flavisolibacter sp.]